MAFYPNYYNYGNFGSYSRGNYINPMQQTPDFQPQPQVQPQQSTNEMIWVLNENEATAFPVAPSCNVILWDKQNPTLYIKSANAQGVPSMRVLDYKERVQGQTQTKTEESKDFVKSENFNDLKARFEALQNDFENLKTTLNKPKPKARKDDEIE